MSEEKFSGYWARRTESLEAAAFSSSRGISAGAPHGVRIEAGEMLLSAWVGEDATLVDATLTSMRNAARRILDHRSRPADPLEATAWDWLLEDKSWPEPDDEGANSASLDGDSPPVGLIRLELVGSVRNLPEYRTEYVIVPGWEGAPVPFQKPMVVPPPAPHQPQLVARLRVVDRLSNGFAPDSGQRLMLALVRFGDMLDLIRQGNDIFDANVRGFLGAASVTNKRLKQVFESIAGGGQSPIDERRRLETQALFPFLNNGITICHSGHALDGQEFVLVDPQVVNGQQTIRTWHQVYESTKEHLRPHLEDIVIAVRLVQVGKDEDLRRIAFANNRQNAVSSLDLRANEPCMKVIESCFKSTGGGIAFQRKAGTETATKTSLNGNDIHHLHSMLMDVAPRPEEFFNDEESFKALFEPLAKALGAPGKVDRLAGLCFLSRISLGSRKRSGLVDLLSELGVRTNSMGHEYKDGRDLRRSMVYAVWPLINKSILHALLKNPDWQGVSAKPELFRKHRRVWIPSETLLGLISPVKLPTNLFSDLERRYDAWLKMEGAPTEEEDEDALLSAFISETFDLLGEHRREGFLKFLGVPQANLLADL